MTKPKIDNNHFILWVIINILLLANGPGNAQDVECDFYTTLSASDHRTIEFTLPEPVGFTSGFTETTISGTVSPGSGISALAAPPIELFLDGTASNPPDLSVGTSSYSFGAVSKTINFNVITFTPDYEFTIIVDVPGGTTVEEDWELRFVEPMPGAPPREIKIAITSVGDGTEQKTILGACPSPVINITDAANNPISALDFPETIVGNDRTLSLKLHNTAPSGEFAADLVVTGSTFSSVNFSAGTSPPPITPGNDDLFAVTFEPALTLALGPVAATTLDINLYGNPSVSAPSITLNGIAIKLKIVVCLDLSGSMTFNPDGSLMFGAVPEDQSRLYFAKQRLKPFFDMLRMNFTDQGDVGFVVFPHPDTSFTVDRSTAGPPYPPGGPPPPPPVPADMGNIDASHINNDIKSPHLDDILVGGLVASGDTPLAEGLERSVERLIPGGPFYKKLLFLITDGAHHADSSPPFAGTRSEPEDYYLPADATNYLNTNGITVYTLGMGVESGGTDEYSQPELQLIAGNTGGFHQDVDLLDAMSFTNAIKTQLQTSLGLAALVDPVDNINIGEIKKHNVYINSANSAVTFFLAWQHFQEGLLNFELVTPLCDTIDSDVSHPDIEYISGIGYKIYHIREDYLKDPNTLGEWNLVITYENDILEGNSNETYSYSVLAKSALPITAIFNQATYFTGDTIGLEVVLTENGAPVLEARVSVDVKVPQNTVNNWLSTNLLSQSQVDSFPRAINGENLTRGYQKRTAIINLLGEKFRLRTSTLRLLFYDDGSHGDKDPNDGVYTNLFTETKIPGSYSFNIDVLGRTLEGSIFTRNTIVEQFVDVNFSPDVDNSPIVFTPIDTIKGLVSSNVTISPKDKFGNFFGLDREDEIDFTIKEGTGTLLSDTTGFDPNGGYFTIVQYDPETQNPVIGVNFQGKTLTQPSPPRDPNRFGLSTHFGSVFPQGDSNKLYDPGFAATFDLAYKISKAVYFELHFGYYRFQAAPPNQDLKVTQYAANLKYVRPTTDRLKVFVNGGGGLYRFDPGKSRVGMNIGTGMQYNFQPKVVMEIAYNFHRVFDMDPSFHFSTLQMVIRYRF